MKPRFLPPAIASFALFAAISISVRADDPVESTNFKSPERFRLEVSGDEFDRDDWVYLKLDFNPNLDEETRRRTANLLRAKNMVFFVRARRDERSVRLEPDSEGIDGFGGTEGGLRGVVWDPDRGFPLYGRIWLGTVARALAADAKDGGALDRKNGSASFQFEAQTAKNTNGMVKKYPKSAENIRVSSRALTLKFNGRQATKTNPDRDLERATLGFGTALEREESEEKLVPLLDELEKRVESRNEVVGGFFLRQASDAFFDNRSQYPSDGELARRIERIDERIGLRRETPPNRSSDR